MESKKEEISRIIKMLRKQGMSITDIASRLELNVVTVGRYEAEEIDNPPFKRLKKLRRLLKGMKP